MIGDIIIPRKQSKPVTSFKEIEEEAVRTAHILRNHSSGNKKRSIALHHSQVSTEPYDFFVVDPQMVGANRGAFFIIVNPKILAREDRQKVREGCMSFPFRPDIPVNRYLKLTVAYDAPNDKGELEHREEVVAGLLAQVFQHEAQHARGEHIYL